jgi:DNA-binding CsgD family transcriptional regulator/tetratricopeptide (TPR) repeat protein
MLLERSEAIAALHTAAGSALRGHGGIVMLTGEAGIGKSSVVRAFLDGLDERVRVLLGACDDLLAPRALGPLRDAAAGTGGPLERAMDGPTDAVFGAAVAQLSGPRPTVLVVEDVHWADDATLDVLRYLARRVADLPAVLLLTLRDAGHRPEPVRQFLGTLSGIDVTRVALEPLSPAAVAQLSAPVGRDGATVHEITGGNPFYVTEALAAPPDASPASVADAVLGRVRRLGPRAVAALEQLAVVPNLVELPLAEVLLGADLGELAEAEQHGMVEVRDGGIAFRHELARRSLEAGMSRLRRRGCHLAVIGALRTSPRPDPERLVHHAVEAHDGATVVEFAPAAGRAAAAAGSHRQALAHFAAAADHADRLDPAARARLLDDHAWELDIALRFPEAVATARAAVRQWEQVGDRVGLGMSTARLARHVFMTGESDEAEQLIARAVGMLAAAGPVSALASASVELGALLVLTGQTPAALPALRRARELAVQAQRPDLESLSLNYLGLARADDGDPAAGEADLRTALAIAVAGGYHEAAARAYVNLGELLQSLGDWPALGANAEVGLVYATEHGIWQQSYIMELHLCQGQVFRGEWDAATTGLRALLDRRDGPSTFDPASIATYGRLLARRGDAAAADLLHDAWRRACGQRGPLQRTYAGRALVEWAWLTGAPAEAQEVAGVLLPQTRSRAWAYLRGELLRYLARAGLPAEPFDGCPEVWASGLRGDWRAAADAWERAGDPYERALELVWSGEPEPAREGLRILDGLGAHAAAALARRHLRERGIRPPPPARAVPRAHPAGLTDRQVDVLELMEAGSTNAEIADRLGLSVRTVDHHVSAILARLGAGSRREAAALARSWAAGHDRGASEAGAATS